jgi:hypothetical protein
LPEHERFYGEISGKGGSIIAMIIKVEKPPDLQAVVVKARDDAEKYNIVYEGDSNSGYCSGHGFEGTYVVDRDYIVIAVKKKPAFVTKARVEKEVRKYFKRNEENCV